MLLALVFLILVALVFPEFVRGLLMLVMGLCVVASGLFLVLFLAAVVFG